MSNARVASHAQYPTDLHGSGILTYGSFAWPQTTKLWNALRVKNTIQILGLSFWAMRTLRTHMDGHKSDDGAISGSSGHSRYMWLGSTDRELCALVSTFSIISSAKRVGRSIPSDIGCVSGMAVEEVICVLYRSSRNKTKKFEVVCLCVYCEKAIVEPVENISVNSRVTHTARLGRTPSIPRMFGL
jgi:hypothetical protein